MAGTSCLPTWRFRTVTYKTSVDSNRYEVKKFFTSPNPSWVKDSYLVVDVETEGLDFWRHRVVGIGLCNNFDDRFLTHPDEKVLLETFWKLLRQYPDHFIIGFNILSYDLQFLILRSLKHGVLVEDFSGRCVDLRQILTGNNKYARGRLEDYVDLLGQRPRLNGFRKRDLTLLWEDPEQPELIAYALTDVRLTHLLFLRMRRVGLL